jgi:hypothetical protein
MASSNSKNEKLTLRISPTLVIEHQIQESLGLKRVCWIWKIKYIFIFQYLNPMCFRFVKDIQMSLPSTEDLEFLDLWVPKTPRSLILVKVFHLTKWKIRVFYPTSRHRKIKILTKLDGLTKSEKSLKFMCFKLIQIRRCHKLWLLNIYF